MKLSKNFSLEEMTRTSTGLQNEPQTHEIVNLTRLCAKVLQPLRTDSGALTVTSGYRSEEVNSAVGGSAKSYHRMGLAADIQSNELTPEELAERIQFLKLPIDKVIVEFGRWVHIQIKPTGETDRNQFLVAEKVSGETVFSFMA